MTAVLPPPITFQGYTQNGHLNAFGFVATYAAGSTTPIATYTDATQTQVNPNPVPLNAIGQAAIWLAPGVAYKFIETDQFGNQCGFADQINASGAGITSSLIPANNNILNIGSPTFQWANGYFGTGLFVNGVSVFLQPTAAEGSLAINLSYPVGNALRYGIIPNNAAVAASNQTIIKALCSYSASPTGWTGNFTFPNTTGSDIYYFTNYIDFRPGISVDLQFCTLQFNKAAPDGTDNNSGFIMAIRDFEIKNGSINVNFTSGPAGCSAIFFGARDSEGVFYSPFYDSVYLAATGRTMGNIKVSNIYVTMNTPGIQVIGMLGGLQDVLFENVWIDGQSVALDGVYGEYGFATDGGGVATARQSSHANNVQFKNIKVTNIGAGSGIAFNGGYNFIIDGLRVIGAGGACGFGFGEAYYLNPWSGQDGSGDSKRTVTIRDVIAKNLTGTGISIQGANTSAVAGGYLAPVINALSPPQLYQVQTDLCGAIIDGFAINGTSAGLGIQILGADHIEISNGRLVGFSVGISTTAELNHYAIRNVDILNSSGGAGIVLGNGFAVWSPPRFSVGEIKGCFIAGTTGPAISLFQIAACRIASCRFGYSLTHDGITETTQTNAVSVGATCGGVICENNYVAATSGGNVAYALSSSLQSSNGCMINNPQGVLTQGGTWGVDGTEVANGSQLGTAAAQINTTGKYLYRRCLDGSNNKLYFAQGPNPTDAWIPVDGSSTITPA